jgi:hypothetical protein
VKFSDGHRALFDPASGFALPIAHDRGSVRLPDGTFAAYDEVAKEATVGRVTLDCVCVCLQKKRLWVDVGVDTRIFFGKERGTVK